MGWSGGGVVTPLYVWNTDKLTYPNITAVRVDSLNADLCTAIQNCMARDGQNAAAANLSMGGFRLTNLAPGTSLTDAATYGQIVGAGAGTRNYLMNGNFRYWQRYGYTGSIAVAVTNVGAYTADRWMAYNTDTFGSGLGVTQVVNTTAGFTSRYQTKLQRNNGSGSVGLHYLGQSIDAVDLRDMLADAALAHGGATSGRNLYFSVQVIKGANAPAGATLTLEILGNATASANSATAAGWNVLATASFAVSGLSTTVAQSKFCSILGTSLNLTYNSYAARITYLSTGTAGADDSVTLAQAQLYFSNSDPTTPQGFDDDPGMIYRLMKYYQRSSRGFDDTSTAAGTAATPYMGFARTTNNLYIGIPFAVPMSKAPTNLVFYRGNKASGAGNLNYITGASWNNSGANNLTAVDVNPYGCTALCSGISVSQDAPSQCDFNWVADTEF